MIAQVAVQDADQDGRYGDHADRAVGAVLEAACRMGPAGAGPGGAAAGTGGREDDRPAPVCREDEILAAQGDGFFRAQRRVVQAAEERGSSGRLRLTWARIARTCAGLATVAGLMATVALAMSGIVGLC